MTGTTGTPPVIGLTLFALVTTAQAQGSDPTTTDSLPIYDLGTVTVVADSRKEKQALGTIGSPQVSSIVTLKDIERFDRKNVGDALDLLAGVTLSNNLRNEKLIYIRGFDSRQVPLFVDGIPVYVPYDGYIDFNRFTTADLAAIQVAKGFSSVSYGANTLGGAINMITRKPQRALEGDVSVGYGDGESWTTSANVGSNQGTWYVQAGGSWSSSDYFRMASDSTNSNGSSGGRRDNSYRKDEKFSFKLGLTPNDTDEYSIGFYRQHGKKGQPPSTDPSDMARYWQWPYWDKEGIYFISNTALTQTESMKVRLYYDRYDNEVNSYTDDTYGTLKTSGKGSVSDTGHSVYNDRTAGGSVELRSTRFARNDLTFSAHVKQDRHRADDTIELSERYEDTLTSYTLEDNITLRPDLTLSLGVAYHKLDPDEVYKSSDQVDKPGSETATDGQAGLFWDYTENARFYATIARKTRFPTLKDRYSIKLGRAVPNPNLKAEQSMNYEIGYKGTPWQGGKAEASVFLSDVDDLIQEVDNVVGDRYQMQNVGEVRIFGTELGLSSQIGRFWEVGANLTLMNRKNRSDDTRLTGVPNRKAVAYARFMPNERWQALLYVHYEGPRWDSDTEELDDFTTASLKLAYKPSRAWTIEGRLENLADEDYELTTGYPAPGRMWYANIRYEF